MVRGIPITAAGAKFGYAIETVAGTMPTTAQLRSRSPDIRRQQGSRSSSCSVTHTTNACGTSSAASLSIKEDKCIRYQKST